MTDKSFQRELKSRLAAWFLAIVALYFAIVAIDSYLLIRAEKHEIQEIYELSYSSKNSHATITATELSGLTGIKSIPTLQDSELVELIVNTSAGKLVVAKGQAAITRKLAVFFDDAYPPVLRMFGGALFLLILSSVLLMPVSLLGWQRVACLTGAVATAAIFSGCAACGTAGNGPLSEFSSYLPLVGGVWFASCCILSFSSYWSSPFLVYLTLAISTLALILQGILMFVEPKACFFCALVAGANAFILRARADQSTMARFVQVPYLKLSTVVVLCALIIAPKVSLTFGFVRPPTSRNVNLKEILGDKATDHIHGTISLPSIMLVTSQGCEACQLAKQDLKQAQVAYREILPCSSGGQSEEPCYDSKGGGMVTPTLLVVNENGVIVYANVGWPSSGEQVSELIQYVKQTAGKNPLAGGKNEE